MFMSDDKYDRLKRIPNWSQEKLAQAKVAVFGCGALGNEVLKNLALLGVGNIWVVDYDTIEKHNLTRSVLFRESDIGRYKAEVVAERVKELNPDSQVHPILGKLEFAFGRGLLREMDVAFGCLDSIGARRELNKRCYFAGVPWIDGGINHQLGNVALFDPRVPETACYRCQMDKSAWARLNERYSCGYLKDSFKEPTMATTIMTSSVIAAYQVEVAVQLLLFGESNLKPGTKLFLPVSMPVGFTTPEFTLDRECPDHASIPQNGNTSALPVKFESTPKQVAQELDLWEDWKLELPFDFVSKFTCDKCGHIEPVRKPLKEIKQGETKCPQCGNVSREAVKYFQITGDSEDADLTFKDFGLAERELLHYSGIKYQWKVNIELFSELEEIHQETN
ncbi:MAG: ThiF family adenylyltransferase [Oscillatoriales cyanobacterium]|nr:MAG: ThiF family adenylyltransferase [Oscillatoriales cyanobacterium]TAH15846.1 MAG: ThiF family adenylyltransferase [Oscillatoriales cyanobacterium]